MSDIVDCSAYMGQSNSLYLPYKKLSYYFDEYQFFCTESGVDDCEVAGKTTFKDAFEDAARDIYKEHGLMLKFNGGKGNVYSTCSIVTLSLS